MKMSWSRVVAAAVVLWVAAGIQAQTFLKNEGFEATRVVTGAASSDGGFGVWTTGQDHRVPTDWSLNSAFPGEVSACSDGAHGGKGFLRIVANGKRGPAHVFQPCPGIQSGKAYKVSAWARGGGVSLYMYEYFNTGPMKVPRILTATPGPAAWKELTGYYLAPAEGLKSASLAIVAEEGQQVDLDDVRIEELPPQPSGLQGVAIETERLRVKISPRGVLEEFTCKQTGANFVDEGSGAPLFRVTREDADVPVRFVEQDGDRLRLHLLDPEVKVSLIVTKRAHYFTIAVESVTGAGVDSVQLCDLRLKIAENVGTLVNAAWDDRFGACVLACNDRTYSYGANGARAALCARCYREFGMEGAKVAVIGTPTGAPDPASKLLDVIEEVELEQGLPHPTINGVWIKRAKERLASYLMACGGDERNIDEVVEFAKGGFGCVELVSWWESTPTYNVNPKMFPTGRAGLKMCADKIHAAGMQVGLHTMQGMVGWGGIGMKDPHVVPKADPRLLRDRFATLAAAIGPEETEIRVKEGTADWPDDGDLFIEGEVVRYKQRKETGFAQCQRGLHGTTIAPHAEGAQVSHLVNCFNMWGSVIYAPDIKTNLVEEIADNIARVFNETGADMTYFDAGEELYSQKPSWRNQGYFALNVMKRLKKPFVLEGNAIYTHLSWHVISRGSPTFDPVCYGRRDYNIRHKGQNPARWAKNLLTGDVGWFYPTVHSPSTDACTPDEVMLLCLKALGGKAPISFQVHCNNLYANKRIPEMLDIIRTCDELKRREYFSEQVCTELAKPMVEHVLEQAAGGEWVVRPLQFGPSRFVTAHRPGSDEWRFNNPFDEQAPWLRLRARTRLAKYGAKENIVLADFEKGSPFTPTATASTELTQTVEPSTEKTPDGSSAFCYRVKNAGKARSGWAQLSLEFPKPLDLSRHRRMGVWVRSEGTGGILNVQYAQGYGFQDHYIPLDFKGWSYRELDPPEVSRFWDYRWPYNFIAVFAWHFNPISVKGLNLYTNDLPPNSETPCLIGRIEALREEALPLESPAIEVAGRRIVFPASLQPDEYLEMDWTGACRHFEPNGGLLAVVKPQGQVRLAAGENAVRFSCTASDSTSPRAEVTLAVKGAPLPNSTKLSGEPTKAGSAPGDERLRLLSNGKGGFRLLQGLYELADREPARAIPAFDGKANVWTVVNPMTTPCRAAIVLSRGAAGPDADYDDPNGLLLESFDDLAPYAMSETNRFEKFVLGGGKQLSKNGPVREGVSQSFVAATDDARVGGHCGVYAATNDGGPGGWGGVGRRFAEPINLSPCEALALWVCGDGKGEALRFQIRDTAGAYADWVVPIDFVGWRLLVFKTADHAQFNWKQAEYVLFYFNNVPAKTAVAMKLDDLKALSKLRRPPALRQPRVIVNGKALAVPADVDMNETLLIDPNGRCSLWPAGSRQGRDIGAPLGPIVLHPGPNRLELSCDPSQGAPRDVSVRVLRLGPTGD